MKIYIPTMGRSDKQVTYQSLSPNLRARTNLVVPHKERDLYAGYPHLVTPPSIKNIGDTRQWIYEYHHKARGERKFVMCDDDLTFAMRRKDDPTKFSTQITASQMDRIFYDLANLLDVHAFAGILPREGGNRVTKKYISNSRLIRVYAYKTDVLHQHRVKFNQCGTMDDFDVALQLLTKGESNGVLCYAVQNQGGSQAIGGAALYRTMDTHAKSAQTLKERHPDFVTLVTKKTKVSWGGGERTDVIIQWKKAYESGKR